MSPLPRAFYRLGTLATVLAFLAIVGAFWRAPEHVPAALGTFAAVASLALAGGGAREVARNWAGRGGRDDETSTEKGGTNG